MNGYYHHQASIYDATRWMFLHGRERLVQELDIRPGERVLEIGCGTGKNFEAIQAKLQDTGELIGIDCCRPMLNRAAQRVLKRGWKNVRLLDMEYGKEPITRGRADVVLFSYSLSMMPDWELAIACARSDLWPGGRIGVVDFHKPANGSRRFADWLAVNHVAVDRPYEEKLLACFTKNVNTRYSAWAGLWSFYLFIGVRPAFSISAGIA
jgi:S-adenosylmethionine-diacylgycerolhomoserine-N-methlytransferase